MDDWKSLLGAGGVTAILIAAFGGFWKWLTSRRAVSVDLKKVDVDQQKVDIDYQDSVQKAFLALTDQLQEELVRLRSVIVEQNQVIAAQATEITQLRGEVRQLTQGIQSFYRLLNQHGITIPPELKF